MRKLLAATTVTFVVVAATGTYLAFRYEPVTYGDGGRGWRGWLVEAADVAHRWGSYLFLLLLLASAVVWSRSRVRESAAPGRWFAVALGVTAVGAVAAVITGPLLRWDQVALWAVTVGDGGFRGGVIDLDSVKFLLRGAQEVSVEDFRRDVLVHALILPLVLVASLGGVWCLSRRSPRRAADSADVEVSA